MKNTETNMKSSGNHEQSDLNHWHSIRTDEVYKKLDTRQEGLSGGEAEKRLETYGENKLPDSQTISLWKIMLHQILHPLIFILIAAAIASILIGEGKDAVFIFIVILINTTLGTYQEFKAEKSAAGLQSMLKIQARVRRDGNETDLESEGVVPGDIVLLESGIKVPADIRLMEASDLEIDESFLTGESMATIKETGEVAESTRVSEMKNMAFAGSTIMKGRGWGVVVHTGLDTQVGKISQDVTESESAKPPLVHRMEKFIKQISIFVIALSVILGIILRLQGMDMEAIFFFIVALAVSAIPEGLPVALTVALSIATNRMAKRNVIVRKLSSVESLGSCTVIASDKTGTLTVNEQTAKKIVIPSGEEYMISGQGYNGDGEVAENSDSGKSLTYSDKDELHKITRTAVLANEGSLGKENDEWKFRGDAMDIALLGMSYKLGVDPEEWRAENISEGIIPYESERKYSASFNNVNGSIHIELKGAVETIIEFCDSMSIDGSSQDIDRESILNESETLAREGYRVLGFAGGEYTGDEKSEKLKNEDIPSLTFYGLVGFIDPLRSEAKASIDECKEAGIKVIMITGDHPETAGTIARELGIMDKETKVVTGQMLADSGSAESREFEDLVETTTVFARISPSQKLEIVDVLIRNGDFVAVTGDGVNDAPALKRANIGVAMGSGTDVAKEVGSMIVVDDNFSSIVAGVEEGRFAYDNVRKVIYLLISTGAAEIVLFIASIFAGLPLPLLAVQLLWLNLVTNGIQDVALAFEAGEPGAMKRSPRKPSEKIFNSLMIRQTVVSGATMGAIVFGLWMYLIQYLKMDEISSRNMILLLMVFMQNFHAFNCRSERVSAFKVPIKRNLILVFGVLAAQGLHILSMQIPFMQNILRVEPISLLNWLNILILAIPILVVMELFKFFQKSDEK
jgi:magnesium-transporting ATPase (P-type)